MNKTRQELVLDFMLALAPNIGEIYARMKEDADGEPVNASEGVYATAVNLVDVYFNKTFGGY
jgi:hypothetical protein